MYTESQKQQMSKPEDTEKSSRAALKMKAELDALIAQMEADAKQHAQQTENLAAAITEVRKCSR